MHLTKSPTYFLFLAVVPFFMLVISFSGLFMKADLTGRLVMGISWSIVFIGWLSQLFQSVKKN